MTKGQCAVWDTLARARAITVIWGVAQGPKSFRELRTYVGGSFSTLRYRIMELKDIGLLEVGCDDVWPYRHKFSLTPKGQKISELLAGIENEMKEAE